MMKRRYALITLICLTQIVNSNMAVIAAIIGIGCSRLNINIKIATVLILGVLVYSLGAVFFPRFYDEFVSGDGTRTLDILLQQHVFVVGNLDFLILYLDYSKTYLHQSPILNKVRIWAGLYCLITVG